MVSIYRKMEKSARQVAKYLKELGLIWKYEFPVFVYDDKDRPRLWTPDFYIPSLEMFIEVCGQEDFDYDYREKVYVKNGIYVVFVHFYKDPKKWKYFLVESIKEKDQARHSEVMKMIERARLDKKREG